MPFAFPRGGASYFRLFTSAANSIVFGEVIVYGIRKVMLSWSWYSNNTFVVTIVIAAQPVGRKPSLTNLCASFFEHVAGLVQEMRKSGWRANQFFPVKGSKPLCLAILFKDGSKSVRNYLKMQKKSIFCQKNSKNRYAALDVGHNFELKVEWRSIVTSRTNSFTWRRHLYLISNLPLNLISFPRRFLN